ncbi:MAG: hypothetical protein GKS02_05925 [Alphaproteobacteria bacterium]|nr:hypothetical protein [Alphaproteobacteria bacterium]
MKVATYSIGIFLMCTVVAVGDLTANEMPLPETVSDLSGAQIEKLVSGNTVYWRNANKDLNGYYYYAPNGEWKGACCGSKYGHISGPWSINENQVCQEWKTGASYQIGRRLCFAFSKSGDGYFYGKAKVRKIVEGNPEGN